MEQEDMPMLLGMMNDPSIEYTMGSGTFPLSRFEQERWYEMVIGDPRNLRLIIELASGQSVGLVTLTSIDWKNRVASHGIKISNIADRGTGTGTDSVMALMRYAFEELQLHRLETVWFPDNVPSRKLYLKCGWAEEGVRRSCAYQRSQYRDMCYASILEPEYRALVAATCYWDI